MRTTNERIRAEDQEKQFSFPEMNVVPYKIKDDLIGAVGRIGRIEQAEGVSSVSF